MHPGWRSIFLSIRPELRGSRQKRRERPVAPMVVPPFVSKVHFAAKHRIRGSSSGALRKLRAISGAYGEFGNIGSDGEH